MTLDVWYLGGKEGSWTEQRLQVPESRNGYSIQCLHFIGPRPVFFLASSTYRNGDTSGHLKQRKEDANEQADYLEVELHRRPNDQAGIGKGKGGE